MIRLIIKFIGIVALVAAIASAIIDLTKSIADSELVISALGQQWADFHTTSLQYLQVGIQRKLGIAWAWDVIFVPVLQMPGWLVFGILALLLLWAGRRPDPRLKRRLNT